MAVVNRNHFLHFQLEDIEVVVADHVQGIMKTNFLASWDEIGDECELEDTYALSTMKDLDGNSLIIFSFLCNRLIAIFPAEFFDFPSFTKIIFIAANKIFCL